ncbi:MAG: hypothetical protein MI892_23285, partial [Desulfobacterales bacterium]|nr:hypothetical protein [Desulfobacterales bacterium]
SNRFLGRWSPLERHFQILIWTLLFSLAMGLFLVHGWIVEAWIAYLISGVIIALPMALASLLFDHTFFLKKSSRKTADVKAYRLKLTSRYTGCFLVMNLSMLAFLAAIILDRI